MPLEGTFEGVLESSTNLCLGQTEFVTDRQIYCHGGYYRIPENNRVCVFCPAAQWLVDSCQTD